MKNWQETHRIVKRLTELERAGRSAATAVIVRIRGSTYRRPGAKLLIEDDGRMTGNVSGGCLEADVREVGLQVMRTKQARLVHYDTGDDEDMLWGMGLGCNGEVDLLILPHPAEGQSGYRQDVPDRLNGEQPFVLGVGCRDRGEGVGYAVVTPEEARFFGETNDLERAKLESLAREALIGEKSLFDSEEGVIRFADVFLPPPYLLICGAGDDAIPLARFANESGFRVVVADHRPAYVTEKRFPDAWRLICARPEEADAGLPANERTHAVIMTHALLHDRAWAGRLVPTAIPYIGLLGPRDRRDEILKEVKADDRDRIYGPAGLDLGGEGPELVALSILSEVLCIWSGRNPIHLRERDKAIHAE